MKKILVALDGSPRAAPVLAQAVELALPTRATLVLFRAFHMAPELTLAWPVADRPLERALRVEAEQYLREQAQTVPNELTTEILVVEGDAWHAVCAAARRENVDLVVIGSHGYRGLDHLLGTTAARIVNHADRSVLVARAAA